MGSVRFGDYPESVSGIGFVAAEKPEAFLHAELVFLAVFFAKLSPIPRDMTREEVHRTLSALFESGERSRRSDELPEVKQRFSFSLLHGESPAVEFGYCFPGTAERCMKSKSPRGEVRRLSVRAV